jgi:hypothetical protein
MIVVSDPTTIFVVVLILFVLPFIPLGLLWAGAVQNARQCRGFVRLATIGVTLSFSFFVISIENEYLMGSPYGNQRFLTILLNFGLMATTMGYSLRVHNPLRWRLFWASGAVAWLWFYALMVSHVA